jgi:hypothetical protein
MMDRPSESLVMPKEEVLKTELVPPSGALLEWLEMFKDEQEASHE